MSQATTGRNITFKLEKNQVHQQLGLEKLKLQVQIDRALYV